MIRLPRISNFTDLDALALEPGVAVRFVSSPAELADADLVVVPGTRATVADLGWLAAGPGRRARAPGGGGQARPGDLRRLPDARQRHRRRRREQVGAVAGLRLLPVATRFAPGKTLGRPAGYGPTAPVVRL